MIENNEDELTKYTCNDLELNGSNFLPIKAKLLYKLLP
jgi:hypothetical protein